MKINKDIITTLNPCKDRLDNYLKFYGDKEFTPNQFMGLRNITHQDKIWVAMRLISKEKLGKVAGEIALTVLPIYEKKYPNDLRPRRAIEAAMNGEVTKKIRRYVHAAIDSAHAAYYAAHNAIEAAHAAAYNATLAADADTYADSIEYVQTSSFFASCATDSTITQQKLIRKIMLKYWK